MSIHPSLTAFFAEHSIIRDEEGHSNTPNSAIEPDDGMISILTDQGLLGFQGPDSAKFLQGQTTCDVNQLDTTHTNLGAYCTPKGRMLTSFRMVDLESDNIVLRMQSKLVANTQAALAKYLVFSKAKQTDLSNEFLLIGLYGKQAAQTIANCFKTTPTAINKSVNYQGNVAIQVDAEGNTFECWIQASQVAELWPQLSQHHNLQGSRSWQLLAIRRGEGNVTSNTVESFTPQMLNYQITGAVSFTKGCYTGQEVVARLHYKGKLKRQMYRILIPLASMCSGDLLYSSRRQQAAGEIVTAVSLNNNQTEALAVITNDEVIANSVVAGPNSAKVEVLSLPYAITTDT